MPDKPIISPDEAIAILSDAVEAGQLSSDQIAQLFGIVNQARGSVGTTLSVVESALPNLEVISRLQLDKQYGSALDLLRRFGLINPDSSQRLGDVQMPDFDKIKRAFGDKKLDMAQSYSQPQLVIYPDMPFQEQIKRLQTQGYGLGSVYADKKLDSPKQGGRIAKWRASIIDANPIPGITVGIPLKNRLRERNEQRKQHEAVMTKEKALMFILDAIQNRQDIQQLFVLLDGEGKPVMRLGDTIQREVDEILFGSCDINRKSICFNATALGGSNSARFFQSVDADL